MLCDEGDPKSFNLRMGIINFFLMFKICAGRHRFRILRYLAHLESSY